VEKRFRTGKRLGAERLPAGSRKRGFQSGTGNLRGIKVGENGEKKAKTQR